MITRSGNAFDIGTSTFDEMVREDINRLRRESLKIAIPAFVEGISDYETTQCIDVMPVLNDYYSSDDVTINAPTIKKVFVKLPGGNGFMEKMPVAIGDLCTLHWSHKSLNKWLESTGAATVDQDVTMLPELRDCWVELGFGTRSNNYSPSATNYIFEGDGTTVTITPAGKITVSTDSDVDITIKGNKTESVAGNVNVTISGNSNINVTGTSYITSSQHTIDTSTIINGNLTVNGDMSVLGESGGGDGTATIPNLVVDDSLKAGNVEVIGHVHGGVETGDGTTDAME